MKNRRSAIATLLTIGALVVIGISALASSFLINQKNTTNSKAAERVQCDDPAWVCGSECASQQVRDLFKDAAKWRAEAARNLPSKNCDSSDPIPTTLPCPGGNYDKSGICNPACCVKDRDDQCPSGQKCNISNGYCVSEFSCNTNSAITPTSSQNPGTNPTTEPTNAPTATGIPHDNCYEYIDYYSCYSSCTGKYGPKYSCGQGQRWCCLSTPGATVAPTIQPTIQPTIATPTPLSNPTSSVTPITMPTYYPVITNTPIPPTPITTSAAHTIEIFNPCQNTSFIVNSFYFRHTPKPVGETLEGNGSVTVSIDELCVLPSDNDSNNVGVFSLIRQTDKKSILISADGGLACSNDYTIAKFENSVCN